MEQYEKQANGFLTSNGMTFSAIFKGDKCPLWCEDGKHGHGDRYRVTISRKGTRSRLAFDFWNSVSDKQAGKEPTAYDVLACIYSDSSCPETFEDFCGDYGYDLDSRKAEKTFKASDRFARRIRDFFTADELDSLQDIR